MISEAWDGLAASVATTDDPFPGGGAMAQAIRAVDWGQTSLGPVASWPLSLKAVLRMMLASRQPMCLFWGPELRMLYNDAYGPMLGQREGAALGQPFHIAWADVWHDVLPITRSALSGVSQRLEEMPLVMTRNGFAEQTYWTFSYTPLRDDEGRVAGLINMTKDVTAQVRDRQALVEAAETAARMLEEQRQNNRQRMILQRELSHRMKNTLSIVQAIVSQSMRHSPDMATASDRISGRLSALSSAQDILTESSWVAAEVSHVIARGLAPYRDGAERIRCRPRRQDIGRPSAGPFAGDPRTGDERAEIRRALDGRGPDLDSLARLRRTALQLRLAGERWPDGDAGRPQGLRLTADRAHRPRLFPRQGGAGLRAVGRELPAGRRARHG